MSRRLLFLRAVNVGTAQLPMAELKKIATGLGAEEVSTYIASGNLLCVPPGDPEAFDRAVEKAVEQQFGFFREVISRSRDEVEAALQAHPFEVVEPKFSYLSFLSAAPSAAGIEAAASVPTHDDQWQVIGSDLHIRYAAGAGKAYLDDKKLYKKFGVVGTSRNLNTVRKLLDLTT